MKEIDRLKEENKKLRKAARLIFERSRVQSGSLEMANIDSFCKTVGLEVWKWPGGNFWDYDILEG